MLELVEHHTKREEEKQEEEFDNKPRSNDSDEQMLDKNNTSEDLQAVEIDTHFKLKADEEKRYQPVRGFALDQEQLEQSSGSKSEMVDAGTGSPG